MAYVFFCVRFNHKMPAQPSIPGDLPQELERPDKNDPFDTIGEIFRDMPTRKRLK